LISRVCICSGRSGINISGGDRKGHSHGRRKLRIAYASCRSSSRSSGIGCHRGYRGEQGRLQRRHAVIRSARCRQIPDKLSHDIFVDGWNGGRQGLRTVVRLGLGLNRDRQALSPIGSRLKRTQVHQLADKDHKRQCEQNRCKIKHAARWIQPCLIPRCLPFHNCDNTFRKRSTTAGSKCVPLWVFK
jgi:hypothetical protein